MNAMNRLRGRRPAGPCHEDEIFFSARDRAPESEHTAKGTMHAMWISKIKASAAAAVTTLIIASAHGAEKPAQPGKDAKPAGKEIERQGVFAKLPQPDAGHLAKLEALGDDSWISLGSPGADGKWGSATGRSWSPKMPYAPDLHGGFLYGQANHGAHNEQTRCFGDDLWFYHAPSNRWICVWPGTPIDNPKLKINKDGFDMVGDDLAPIGTMVHAYCAVDYDTDTKQFVHMPQNEKNYKGVLEGPIAEMRAKAEGGASAPSPWFFNTISGKWVRKNSPTPGINPAAPAALMFYLPTKKSVWFHDFAFGSNVSAIYDVGKNQWTALGAGKFNEPPTDTDNIAYYDTKRNRVDMLRWGKHWIFDANTLQWSNANSTNLMGAVGYVCTWNYDSVNDVGVMIMYRNGEVNGVHIYDPNKNSWTKTANPIPGWTENGNGFYDPELNVHFFHNARDNSVGGMWAYRYKKAAAKK
jgi:hypothetical protein